MEKINEIINSISNHEYVNNLIEQSDIHSVIKELLNVSKKINSYNYYLEYDLEKEYENIMILLDKIEKDEELIKLYSEILLNTSLLYNFSYLNLSKRELLVKSNRIFNKYRKFKSSTPLHSGS